MDSFPETDSPSKTFRKHLHRKTKTYFENAPLSAALQLVKISLMSIQSSNVHQVSLNFQPVKSQLKRREKAHCQGWWLCDGVCGRKCVCRCLNSRGFLLIFIHPSMNIHPHPCEFCCIFFSTQKGLPVFCSAHFKPQP